MMVLCHFSFIPRCALASFQILAQFSFINLRNEFLDCLKMERGGEWCIFGVFFTKKGKEEEETTFAFPSFCQLCDVCFDLNKDKPIWLSSLSSRRSHSFATETAVGRVNLSLSTRSSPLPDVDSDSHLQPLLSSPIDCLLCSEMGRGEARLSLTQFSCRACLGEQLGQRRLPNQAAI